MLPELAQVMTQNPVLIASAKVIEDSTKAIEDVTKSRK